MIGAFMLSLALASSPPADAFRVTAHIDAERLEVGGRYAIVVRPTFAAGLSSSSAGIPKPLLQIQVPSSAKLVGKVLKSRRELSRNEFLFAPYERVLDGQEVRIPFTIESPPAEGEAFGLNVLAYVADQATGDAWFFRRRLSLPLEAGADSTERDATESEWGAVETLQIGDHAPNFSLPQADGKTVSLEDFRGKNVVVTTYRAHW